MPSQDEYYRKLKRSQKQFIRDQNQQYRDERRRERQAKEALLPKCACGNTASFGEPDCRACRVERERYEQRRYLPASWGALEDLAEALGQDKADKIKALIEAMIQEAMYPETNE